MVRTPSGGRHVYYRCDEVEGNQKLAQRLIRGGGENGGDKLKALIETRGSGGYVLIPGCPVECHPVRRAYEFIQGDLTSIPRITPEVRALVMDSARAFSEYVQE